MIVIIKIKNFLLKIGRSIYRYFVDNRILPQIGSVLFDGLATALYLLKVPVLIVSILVSGFSSAWIQSLIIGGILAVSITVTMAVKLGMYYPMKSFLLPLWAYLSLIAFISHTGIRQIYRNWRAAHA